MEPMTYSIRYWQPLERAFDRMRRILFEPFDLVTWMVLGFSAWLATLGSGNGGGGNFGGAPSDVGDAFGNAASSLFESAMKIVDRCAVDVVPNVVLMAASQNRSM